MDTSRLEATITVASERLETDQNNVEYLRIRGWSYFLLGKVNEALRDFDKAIGVEATDPDLYSRKGDIRYDCGQYQEAVEEYTKAIELAPDSLSYRISRGAANVSLGLYDRALSDYSYVLSIDARNEQALLNRAILFSRKKKDFSNARHDWNLLIEYFPRDIYYHDRGLMFMEFNKYKDAIADFTTAISMNDSSEVSYFNRGYCYGRLGYFQRAFADFDRSQRIDSSNPYLYKYRGEIFMQKGDTAKACTDFKRANEMGLTVEMKVCK